MVVKYQSMFLWDSRSRLPSFTRACVSLCVFHKYWKTLDDIFSPCVSFTLITRFHIVSNWTTRVISAEKSSVSTLGNERVSEHFTRRRFFWVRLWIFSSWTLISSVCSHKHKLNLIRQGVSYQFNVLIHDRIVRISTRSREK